MAAFSTGAQIFKSAWNICMKISIKNKRKYLNDTEQNCVQSEYCRKTP